MPRLPLLLSSALAVASLSLPAQVPAQAPPHPATETAVEPAALSPLPQSPRVLADPAVSPLEPLPGHIPPWARQQTLAQQPLAQQPLASRNLSLQTGLTPQTTDSATPIALTFTLARSPGIQAAFEQFLVDQQTPGSPLFHHWLTPAEVGDLFGPLPSDIAALTAWLNSQGLTVLEVSPSRLFLRVSASASTVARALSLSFGTYAVHGELHRAPSSDPRLPSALLPLVTSIQGLDDLPESPTGHGAPSAIPLSTFLASSSGPGSVHPRYTGSNGQHFITPGDFSLLYDLRGSIAGSGQRVAIIGRSRVDQRDLNGFSSIFHTSSSINTLIPPTGTDPLLTGGGDQLEATLDVERLLGTGSPSIDLVVSANSAGGILPAATYAVGSGTRYAAMNISFGACEADVSSSAVNAWDTLFSQAAAQGISVFVAAGDTGAAGCDLHDQSPPPTVQIASPNYICASSYATCVGGTEFTADLVNSAGLWSSNSSDFTSVLGYMEEGAWNEPTATSASGVTTFQPIGGGGGVSRFIPKPSWQTGPGVPADGGRDTPDISLSSSLHDAYFACFAAGGGDCGNNRFEYFWGTSNAAPSMAGIAAILAARTGSLQGNLNPALYRIAATPAFHAFHDITVASSGVVSCSLATPSPCNTSTPGPSSLTGGLPGYLVGPGYDLATGLGSPDVSYLAAAFAAPSPISLSLFTLNPVVGVGSVLSITAQMMGANFPVPLSPVTFFVNGSPVGTAQATNVSDPIFRASSLPAGVYTFTAAFPGDLFYAPASTTRSVDITVIPPPAFTLTPATPTLTLSAGATSANAETLTLTSTNGMAGSINLACIVVGPTQTILPTCLFSPVYPSLNPNSTSTFAVSLLTTHSALRAGGSPRPPRPWHPLVPAASLALLILLPAGRRLHLPRSLALLPLAFVLTLSGCGGGNAGSSGNTSAPPPPPVAPTSTVPGNYTVTVTAAGTSLIGAVTAQTSFTLIVQ